MNATSNEDNLTGRQLHMKIISKKDFHLKMTIEENNNNKLTKMTIKLETAWIIESY